MQKSYIVPSTFVSALISGISIAGTFVLFWYCIKITFALINLIPTVHVWLLPAPTWSAFWVISALASIATFAGYLLISNHQRDEIVQALSF